MVEMDLVLRGTLGLSTDGSIQTITVTDGGSGYLTAPNVSIGLTSGTYPLFSSTQHKFSSGQNKFSSMFPTPSLDMQLVLPLLMHLVLLPQFTLLMVVKDITPHQ